MGLLLLPHFATLLLVLATLGTFSSLLGVSARPLEQDPSTTVHPLEDTSCRRHLHGHIEKCLERYEQILVTYQARGTTQEQRHRLRARFCHQYQVTLQCLHELLVQCPPQPEHLNLIEVRLGYLRSFMHNTCNVPPESLTPAPTTPAPPTTTISTTPTTQRTTTLPTTTSPPKTTRPVQIVRLNHRDFENNSIKGYTVKDLESSGDSATRAAAGRRGVTATTVAPPSARSTSQRLPTKLELLFGFHGTKSTAGSQADLTPNNPGMLDSNNMHNNVPIRIISREGVQDTMIQGKKLVDGLDCTVDENNKIDVRCIFSGSQRLHTTSLSLVLTLLLTLFLRMR